MLLFKMTPPPAYLAARLEIWDKLKKERDEFIASQERKSITITLPDGKKVDGQAWHTTPYEVAKSIR